MLPLPDGPRESAWRVEVLSRHTMATCHTVRGTPPASSSSGQRRTFWSGEDSLLFLRIPGLPCPQALPRPCTSVSLPIHIPVFP